ncbi:MAG TPA: peptidase [Thermoplasmatales archaeon]|nr:peptidase [Thermoplasmatales archaeon]
MWLQIRLYLLIGILFAIMYGILSIIGALMGGSGLYFYLYLFFIAVSLVAIQYMIGPKMVEITMRVRYVDREEYPELHKMIEELSAKADIPKPKVGISKLQIPNAFAFGRTKRDARVCVTEGLLNLLNEEELRAVLGHEISHIKHRDVFVITTLSVVPTICYMLYLSFFWGGIFYRRREGGAIALIGLIAFAVYLITSLLVMYGSRIREYYADMGSVELGNKPSWLATALYKLVYSSAHVDRRVVKQIAGIKPFFINDPTTSMSEVRELREIDLNLDGMIDENELLMLSTKRVKLSGVERALEIMSSHPNVIKRIKHLAELSTETKIYGA